MNKNYITPNNESRVENIVKKSRFIAYAVKAETRQEALDFLARKRRDYPDARHHCWAYVLGHPESAMGAAMNDDGEPSGTAGKPIFNVIQHKRIGDIIVVVIRYFGGIKLGAGGLIRAYSGAAERVISALETKVITPISKETITLSFAQEQLCRHWANLHDAKIIAVSYFNEVTMTLNVPQNKSTCFNAFCLTHGIRVLR